MTQALDQSILELLNASRDEEKTMLLPVPDRIFGFHAQQAVEKLLKALIGAHQQRYEFTHNIKSLIEQVHGLDEILPIDLKLIESLTGYAGVWRYQEPEPLLAEQRIELGRRSQLCVHLLLPGCKRSALNPIGWLSKRVS